jgi:ABC-type Mn2+/Zn2+ transport system permease subunit
MVVINGFSDLFSFGIIFGFILTLIIIALIFLIFVFWISMLINSITRKYREESDKIVWVLVIIFTGIIGALIYYFIVKKKDKKK